MKKFFLISAAAVCAAMICSCSSSNKAELSQAYYLTFEIAGGESAPMDSIAIDSPGEVCGEDSCAVDDVVDDVYIAKVMFDENGNVIEEDGFEGECDDSVAVAPGSGSYDYYDYSDCSEPCDPVFDPMEGLRIRVDEANANYKSLPVKADEIDGILEDYFVEFQGQVNAEINVYITPVLTANFANVQKQLFGTYSISSQEAAFENLAVEE